MQKEKKVRAYTRKSKSGKTVQVKAHTQKYDAAEEARKAFAAKKGAGEELSKAKKAKAVPADDTDLGFSEADFKAWYHWDMEDDPKNPQALKVKKALIAKMGRSAYNKYEDQMTDSYTARGHLKAFKGLGDIQSKESSKSEKPPKVKETKKTLAPKEKPEKGVGLKAVDTSLARRVMRDEDFDSLKEAKNYLAEMPRKEYNDYVASYKKRAEKEARENTVEGIREYHSKPKTGFHRYMGSKATEAKKTLLAGGYTEIRGVPEVSKKTGKRLGSYTGLIGPDGDVYLYRGGGYDTPALLIKADRESKKAILDHYKRKNPDAKKGASASKTEKPRKSSEPKKEVPWVITYEEQTPMGLSSSATRTAVVYAKTKRGAEGEYRRKYHQGSDSAYATTLYSIKPKEE